MSKRRKVESAAYAAGSGTRLCGVSRNIKGIRDAHAQLDAMAKSGDFVPILDVVEKLARHFAVGRNARRTDGESKAMCRAFADAVLRLHDVVFDRELFGLSYLAGHRERCIMLSAQTYTREKWDGDSESWESPRFFQARGFSRIIGRKPPIFRLLGIVSVEMERYAKEGFLAMAEAGDELEQMARIDVLSNASRYLSDVMLCYEKFRGRFGGEQITLACLRVLLRIAIVVDKFSAMPSTLEYRGIEELSFDMLCRFVVPDLPRDAEGCERYVHDCRREIECGITRLCEAEPILFNEWLHGVIVCLETCVVNAIRLAPSYSADIFALLARSLGRIRDYVNRESFRSIFPPRLLLPIGDSTGYTLSDTILCMRKIAHRGVVAAGLRSRERMLESLRACTVEFLYGQHFERHGNREKLIDEYRKALTAFANRANELSAADQRF